ncbi:hypothetical protein CQ10_34690 [Bradyrhizobium valentinum]|uniref:Uncharacterized protein n=1 Tax=Bradyrhizobium valentinum TaxID=1518501 RepID=A0A0R3KLB6_9BRAD|nr:hypothetical protein CP49_37300 [Bradyrhizobium valentinum]KRQ94004.1 hypothetical protein CQ10_34690 [Bradyrhizobium valentinum]
MAARETWLLQSRPQNPHIRSALDEWPRRLPPPQNEAPASIWPPGAPARRLRAGPAASPKIRAFADYLVQRRRGIDPFGTQPA